jgi:hypothetical protein
MYGSSAHSSVEQPSSNATATSQQRHIRMGTLTSEERKTGHTAMAQQARSKDGQSRAPRQPRRNLLTLLPSLLFLHFEGDCETVKGKKGI